MESKRKGEDCYCSRASGQGRGDRFSGVVRSCGVEPGEVGLGRNACRCCATQGTCRGVGNN